jgi:hypothetical protein
MEKHIEIIIKRSTYCALSSHLFGTKDLETMAMGFFRISCCSNKTKLLVKEILLPKKEDYLDQSGGHVSLRAEFMERCFVYCETHFCHLVDIHTHPWSKKVAFSGIDDREAIGKKIPHIEKYVADTQIAFIVFGLNSTIAKARIWDKKRRELRAVRRIIIL